MRICILCNTDIDIIPEGVMAHMVKYHFVKCVQEIEGFDKISTKFFRWIEER
jgi:hypothetical protein